MTVIHAEVMCREAIWNHESNIKHGPTCKRLEFEALLAIERKRLATILASEHRVH